MKWCLLIVVLLHVSEAFPKHNEGDVHRMGDMMLTDEQLNMFEPPQNEEPPNKEPPQKEDVHRMGDIMLTDEQLNMFEPPQEEPPNNNLPQNPDRRVRRSAFRDSINDEHLTKDQKGWFKKGKGEKQGKLINEVQLLEPLTNGESGNEMTAGDLKIAPEQKGWFQPLENEDEEEEDDLSDGDMKIAPEQKGWFQPLKEERVRRSAFRDSINDEHLTKDQKGWFKKGKGERKENVHRMGDIMLTDEQLNMFEPPQKRVRRSAFRDSINDEHLTKDQKGWFKKGKGEKHADLTDGDLKIAPEQEGWFLPLKTDEN